MTERPWLSILIPVYNVAPYLKDCLFSIANQYQAGIEVLALDDCSTDDSLSVLNALSPQLPFSLHIIQHAKNRGLSAARNSMVDVAQGEYFWFLDSDDALEYGAIEQLKAVVQKYSPELILCDFRIWRDQQKLKHIWRGENHVATFKGIAMQLQSDAEALFEGVYRQGNLHAWSKISRRTLWGDGLRFPEGRLMEDMTHTPRLLLRASSWFYQPSVWVAYRHRPGSILRVVNLKKVEDSFCANDGVLEEWLRAYPNLSNDARFYFSYFCIKAYVCSRRDMLGLQQGDITKPSDDFVRERLFRQVGWSLPRLCFEYLRRMWCFRLLKFLKYF